MEGGVPPVSLPSSPAPSAAWAVVGVEGGSASLPCPLDPRHPGDVPKLVLWYRRGTPTPVLRWGNGWEGIVQYIVDK